VAVSLSAGWDRCNSSAARRSEPSRLTARMYSSCSARSVDRMTADVAGTGIVPHWFLPTNGDSRTDLSLGNPVGATGRRITGNGGAERAPDVGYIGQIARSAEQLGFARALTPTSSWCEDAWLMTAALTQVTSTFKFLVAARPGLMSPTLAAHMAATYQRISAGRLLLNIVTGGDDIE
jgi:alkanesulfonate monooxygenase